MEDLRYGDTLKQQLASFRSNPNSTESDGLFRDGNFHTLWQLSTFFFLFPYLTFCLEVSHLMIPTSQTDETNPMSQLRLELGHTQTCNMHTSSDI